MTRKRRNLVPSLSITVHAIKSLLSVDKKHVVTRFQQIQIQVILKSNTLSI